ncbi:MAG: hypothetical protein JO261_11610 [Alphaproteobacteria bacterium]|nr:hypothetical protein [Alphaproteobacteria bacterium]MBV9694335.1 hypothetical protein [Alphaproteobacteria bacterium]
MMMFPPARNRGLRNFALAEATNRAFAKSAAANSTDTRLEADSLLGKLPGSCDANATKSIAYEQNDTRIAATPARIQDR